MSILRIERVTYGVEDLDAAVRFCGDFGLEKTEGDAKGATFRTRANQYIVVRSKDDPDLPAAVQQGSSVREVVWGTDREASMRRLLEAVGRDRDVAEKDGVATFKDETGFTIGLTIAEPVEVNIEPRGLNIYGRIERWNHSLTGYGRAHPLGIAHIVFDLPNDGHQKAIDFYVERLNFKAVDTIVPTGAFLQCEGSIDHHQLFLCHRTNRAGINHTAFEVLDIDEVIEGGNYLVDNGWKEVRRMARHWLGSNLHRYFECPLGGRFEYSTDMDKVEKTFPPRVWEESPPHHLWMMKSAGD